MKQTGFRKVFFRRNTKVESYDEKMAAITVWSDGRIKLQTEELQAGEFEEVMEHAKRIIDKELSENFEEREK